MSTPCPRKHMCSRAGFVAILRPRSGCLVRVLSSHIQGVSAPTSSLDACFTTPRRTDDGSLNSTLCDARSYPAFRSQSLNVSKHVAVLSELARLVDVYHLLDVSQFEQELACADEHVLHYRELMEKLSSSRWQQTTRYILHRPEIV